MFYGHANKAQVLLLLVGSMVKRRTKCGGFTVPTRPQTEIAPLQTLLSIVLSMTGFEPPKTYYAN